jgi:hypothetical protein
MAVLISLAPGPEDRQIHLWGREAIRHGLKTVIEVWFDRLTMSIAVVS